MSWGLAVELGALKERVSALERDMATIKNWAMRFALMVALWVIAILGNMNVEQLGQLLVSALR